MKVDFLNFSALPVLAVAVSGQLEPTLTKVEVPVVLRAAFAWFQGQPVLSGLICLMLIDVAVGIGLSIVKRTLSSKVSWRGVSKKCITLLIIGATAVVQPFLPSIPLLNIVAFFYSLTEFISILESAAAAGVPLPAGLVEAMATLREQQKIARAQKEATTVNNVTVITAPAPGKTGKTEKN